MYNIRRHWDFTLLLSPSRKLLVPKLQPSSLKFKDPTKYSQGTGAVADTEMLTSHIMTNV